MNILLTSVGRRAYLVQYFKEALSGGGKVFVSNSDSQTVAFQYADAHTVTPLIYSDQYIPFLLSYCKENHIDILLSLFDMDLLVLAKHKHEFAEVGTKVIVSDPSFVEICNDKWKSYCFLNEHGFHVPDTYLKISDVEDALLSGQLSFPIIIKPRFGCGSIGIQIANDMESLHFFARHLTRAINQTYLKFESAISDDKLIFQSMLSGQEYGADAINDLNGNPVHTIVKKKIAMRSGETDIAETVDEPDILSEVERLASITGHIGNLDCDIFLCDGVPYILELNARFGGGYPFSHIAGCNLPKAIIKWCIGENVDISTLHAKPGIRAFKELTLTIEK